MIYKIKNIAMIAMLFTATLLTSCGSSDDDAKPANAELIGTWTYKDAKIDVKINNKTIKDYFVEALGISAIQATVIEALLLEELEDGELKGSTVTFNADGSYSSKSGDGTVTTGTYTINDAKTKVTVIESGETTTFDVKELSSNQLTIGYTEEDNSEDFDDDGTNDTLVASLEVTFSK
jgi:major membrane immunogen (membrane-anchored lipoprotein)